MSRGDPRRLARAIDARGLSAPARLLLDAHRPFRPLLAEMGVVMRPILRPLLGVRYQRTLELLEEEEPYDELISALGDAEHR